MAERECGAAMVSGRPKADTDPISSTRRTNLKDLERRLARWKDQVPEEFYDDEDEDRTET